MNNKKKIWLSCLGVIALLIWILQLENTDVKITSSIAIHNHISDKNISINEEVAPSIKVEKWPIKFIPPTLYTYDLEQDYIEQDNFNPSICDLTQWQKYQKKSLPDIINELEHDYKQYDIEVDKNLHITLYSANMTPYFQKQFGLLMKGVLTSYTNYLNIKSNNKIKVNIIILRDRQSYLRHAAIDDYDPSRSQGVYFGQRNLAFVSYNNEANAIKTAIHEAVHAINLHLIGITSRAFSEGTAEFFEDIEVNSKRGFNIIVSNKKLETEPYLFSLITKDDEWQNLQITKLYYSSWAWISFMMMEFEAKSTLVKYIKTEQQDLCSALPQIDLLTLWRESYIQFESDFDVWLNAVN